jgi:hypothetical protein
VLAVSSVVCLSCSVLWLFMNDFSWFHNLLCDTVSNCGMFGSTCLSQPLVHDLTAMLEGINVSRGGCSRKE